MLAPTCFGSSLSSSGNFLDPSELLEIQTEWVVYHIICGYAACVPVCRGSVTLRNHDTPAHSFEAYCSGIRMGRLENTKIKSQWGNRKLSRDSNRVLLSRQHVQLPIGQSAVWHTLLVQRLGLLVFYFEVGCRRMLRREFLRCFVRDIAGVKWQALRDVSPTLHSRYFYKKGQLFVN
jgi:hypothetical protein